ncbi:MAG: anti-sigma 24 factor [Gammaproteobacteria bacterium]|jgi:sigma-E factor negative regulatory protein RseA|uniref:sigma-E factor negative regulatory protein n=1 Tax=Thauera sp. TaxID=1905334 RepID=UPI002626451D|nr:RseA family anti-sigma factor [Thauera sp.]MCK6372256.1 anti-sigma 24 factor [Gammaproteobacteria bacterium]
MKDKVSALLDGDLDDQGMCSVIDAMRRDGSLRAQWGAYCLIGDTLRGDRAGSSDFVARVMAGLDDEPTLLAPRSAPAATTQRSLAQRMLPLAASVMGVAAVGLVAASLYREEAPAPQLAAGSAQIQLVTTTSVRPVTAPAVDPMREYLLAHQGLSRSGPMPAGVQYVRTVADTREDAGR